MKLILILSILTSLVTNSAFAMNPAFKENLVAGDITLALDTSANFSPAMSIETSKGPFASILAGWYLSMGGSAAIQIFKHMDGAKIKSQSRNQIVFEWATPTGWKFSYSIKLVKEANKINVIEDLEVLNTPTKNYSVIYSARTGTTNNFFNPALLRGKVKEVGTELI